MTIWRAAGTGDLAEVQGLVGHNPGLLNIKNPTHGMTPLMVASWKGHGGVVRWLVDQGAALDVRDHRGATALILASLKGRSHNSIVRLLLQKGADPAIVTNEGLTPLMAAAHRDLEIVHLLLDHPGGSATINLRSDCGRTALWCACFKGFVGGVTALLEGGADPTTADNDGVTPMAIAKQDPPDFPPGITAEGRRECVTALEVRLHPTLSSSLITSSYEALAEA
jgi:uncharacterized protein